MPLVSIDGVSVAYGHVPLLDAVSLLVEARERIAIIGRNGTGKCTLLRAISGEQLPDAGTVWLQPGVRVARLEQDVPAVGRARRVRRRGRWARRSQRAGPRLPSRGDRGRAARHRRAPRAARRTAARARRARRLAPRAARRARALPPGACPPTPSSTRYQAAGGGACCWRARSWRSRTCSCSMSRPITSTSRRSSGSRRSSRTMRAPSCSSRTIARSCSGSPRASSSSIAARSRRGPATTQTFLRKKEEWLASEALHHVKFDKKLAEEEAWLRQRHQGAPDAQRGARAGARWRCAKSARRGATASGPCGCRWSAPSRPDGWSSRPRT